MAEDIKELARRFYEDVWTKGNYGFLDQLLAPDFRGSEPLVGRTRSASDVKGLIESYRKSFPDLVMKADQILRDGDNVIVCWTGTGTHRGEMLGIPATGKKASVSGISVLRFSNGKLAEDNSQWDVFKMMREIGAIGAQPAVAAQPEARPEARH
jgi:steroid delta-isomerase-like uncharacterized protein